MGFREAAPDHFTEAHVVPPLIPHNQIQRKGEHVLINLGGLQNPLWSLEETVVYARKMISALFSIIPAREKVMIATSKAVAERIGSPQLIYTREEMRKILARSKYAFMTPGLGNIYDSALYDMPTIWLPPANDSQGQQLEALRQHGMIDGSVDWKDSGTPIDYREQQGSILEQISAAVHHATIEVLTENFRDQQRNLEGKNSSATSQLLDRFGTNGEERVAQLIYDFAQRTDSTLSTSSL